MFTICNPPIFTVTVNERVSEMEQLRDERSFELSDFDTSGYERKLNELTMRVTVLEMTPRNVESSQLGSPASNAGSSTSSTDAVARMLANMNCMAVS